LYLYLKSFYCYLNASYTVLAIYDCNINISSFNTSFCYLNPLKYLGIKVDIKKITMPLLFNYYLRRNVQYYISWKSCFSFFNQKISNLFNAGTF